MYVLASRVMSGKYFFICLSVLKHNLLQKAFNLTLKKYCKKQDAVEMAGWQREINKLCC